MANLEFNYGAMNSGKSSELIRTAHSYTEQGHAVAIMKPSLDTKGDAVIVSRPMGTRRVDIIATPEMDVRAEVQRYMVRQEMSRLACLLVDEAQFLRDFQVDQLLDLAKLDDVEVQAFGLRTDYLKRMFEGSQRLMELSDNMNKLKAICRCGGEAQFNCRAVDGVFVFDESEGQIAIEDERVIRYTSLCHGCYTEEQAKSGSSTPVETVTEAA